jgi:hypothetical protein
MGGVYRIMVASAPNDAELDAQLGAASEELLHLPSDPDEAVVQTVMEARALTAAFAHCASRARPQLAWRCAKAADEITAVLARYFTV